jgi:hypothetical protein
MLEGNGLRCIKEGKEKWELWAIEVTWLAEISENSCRVVLPI